MALIRAPYFYQTRKIVPLTHAAAILISFFDAIKTWDKGLSIIDTDLIS